MIECLDSGCGAFEILLGVRSRIFDSVARHKLWIVDLKQESGIDDSLVLGLHRVGDREEEGLSTWIILVDPSRDDRAWRRRCDECVFSSDSGARGLQIFDVHLD